MTDIDATTSRRIERFRKKASDITSGDETTEKHELRERLELSDELAESREEVEEKIDEIKKELAEEKVTIQTKDEDGNIVEEETTALDLEQ